jgi:hypothetical protein
MRRKNITGQRFGRLIARRIAPTNTPKTFWECDCDCGAKRVVYVFYLISGHTTSCGCRLKEILSTHKMCRTRPYRIWRNMINRCTNKNDPRYKDYGGRGIKVYPKWRKFQGFWEDMKPYYKDGLSLDRLDTNGNYELGNCRFATPFEQSNNTRFNVRITHNSRTLTLHEWAKELNIKPGTIRARYVRGWSTEDILRTTLEKHRECVRR